MKKILFLFLNPCITLGQNKIDPLPIITDTTENYDIIEHTQKDFFLGWNWVHQVEVDDALYLNFS